MSTTTTTAASARRDIRSTRAGAGTARPGRLAVGLARIGHEVRGYFRSADTVFFTFLFPFIMLGIFTAAFSAAGEISAGPGTESISVGAYYLPGMLAAGMLLSGVQNLAVDIAGEKSDGTLKRLGGTPLSPVSYFLGKIGQVFVTGTFQAALLLLAAGTLFGIALPTEPEAWITFAWVFVLGIGTSALLGIALSSVPRSGKSASAVVVPIMLVLQFISGVYIAFDNVPTWLQQVAALFPLKWIAQGMRSVFFPAEMASAEMAGSWETGKTVLVLLAWGIAGLILCITTFRWFKRGTT
jgi:ABC-2 type transport system permease protein